MNLGSEEDELPRSLYR